MAEYRDIWGCPVTAASREAVVALEATLIAYMAMRVDIGDRLKTVFECDPDMPMGLILKGAFLKMFATVKMDFAAAGMVKSAEEAIAKRSASAREAAHLAALTAWTEGEMEVACTGWEAILVDHPRDVLAIKLSQLNRFYLGVGGDMRDAIARGWHAWDDTVPGYGFIAGSYAFALEEAGDYARAEPLGRRAVELEPADVWSAHAVAHVLEMQGRPEEGLAWLDGLREHWGAVHNFVHHAHWHRALFALDIGDAAQSLAIFDADIWTGRVADYLDLSNGAALLWRLGERGVDTGGRCDAVARLAEELGPDHGLVFSDCHIALALARAGRWDSLSGFIDGLDRVAESGGTQAGVMRDVGRSLCMAAVADAEGDAPRVVELMVPVRGQLHRIGGSHAQRDLFDRMLIANALKAGLGTLARALLSERLERRPADIWGRARWTATSVH